jgi:hypothetical protein
MAPFDATISTRTSGPRPDRPAVSSSSAGDADSDFTWFLIGLALACWLLWLTWPMWIPMALGAASQAGARRLRRTAGSDSTRRLWSGTETVSRWITIGSGLLLVIHLLVIAFDAWVS